MRWGLALLLALLAPGVVAAQGAVVGGTALDFVPRDPTPPLPPETPTPVRVEFRYRYVESTADAPGGPRAEVLFSVAETPAWASAFASPAAVALPAPAPPCGCVREVVVGTDVLVTVGVRAPAFGQGGMMVRAIAPPHGGNAGSEALGAVALVPGYRAALVVDRAPAVFRLRPGEPAEYFLDVRNGANGPTYVTTTVEEAPAGVRASAPRMLTLSSALQGDGDWWLGTGGDVVVPLRAEAGFAGGPMVLRLEGRSSEVPDSGVVTERVTVTLAPLPPRAAPAPGLLAALGLLGLAALATRRA